MQVRLLLHPNMVDKVTRVQRCHLPHSTARYSQHIQMCCSAASRASCIAIGAATARRQLFLANMPVPVQHACFSVFAPPRMLLTGVPSWLGLLIPQR